MASECIFLGCLSVVSQTGISAMDMCLTDLRGQSPRSETWQGLVLSRVWDRVCGEFSWFLHELPCHPPLLFSLSLFVSFSMYMCVCLCACVCMGYGHSNHTRFKTCLVHCGLKLLICKTQFLNFTFSFSWIRTSTSEKSTATS